MSYALMLHRADQGREKHPDVLGKPCLTSNSSLFLAPISERTHLVIALPVVNGIAVAALWNACG